ncbi:Ltp family lipoprotein [Streptococcus australis]|uniref:Ltp family lipoprotein n=1 Tax=Streptococcus australis TaxID=113107 RepID=UPI0039C4C7FC
MKNISWYNTNESGSRGMKDSIGEKQVKVVIMKKFLIFIFTIFGLMVVMFAMMYNEYITAYNEKGHNQSSYSWTKETYSVEKYTSSSDRKQKDDLESLMNMFKKRVYPLPLLDSEYTSAYATAKEFLKKSLLSMQQIKNDLTKNDRYSEDASLYAINKLNIDWKEQAVLKAKSLQMFHFSKEMLVWQLINVELFTQEEADYAIEQVNFDWKEEAVKKVEAIANPGNMSKEELLELLVKKRKFTQEEAEYAIEHAQVDWLN